MLSPKSLLESYLMPITSKLSFTVSSEHEPTMEEMYSINEIFTLYDDSYRLNWDICYDESLGNKMRMTVISYE